MEKEKRMKEAMQFREEGEAYIHIETRKGAGTEIALSGDMIAILCSINSLINRLAEKTKTTFEETLESIGDLQEVRENIVPVASVDGKIEKFEIDKLKDQVQELEKKLTAVEEENKKLKLKYKMSMGLKEQMLKSSQKKIIELNNKVLELDHENDKLTELLNKRG